MCMQADASGTLVKFLTPNGAPVTVGQVDPTKPTSQAAPLHPASAAANNLTRVYLMSSDLHLVNILVTRLQALALIKP